MRKIKEYLAIKKMATTTEISKELNIPIKQLKKDLNTLAEENKVSYNSEKDVWSTKAKPKKAYKNSKGQASSNRQSKDIGKNFKGKLDTIRSGAGFLRVDLGKNGESIQDFFISANALNGALNGDYVEATTTGFFRGRYEAKVVRIIERKTSFFIAKVVSNSNKGFAKAMVLDKTFTPIVDVKTSQQLIIDNIIEIEIINFSKQPQGNLVNLFGNISDAGMDNQIVLKKYGINKDYPVDITKEAEIVAEELFKKENKGKDKNRRDLKKLLTITIDGVTAKDFDDAISIEKNRTSNTWSLYVHIADVSHFVRPGTKLDEEAYNRATSVYFPEFAVHMLPTVLSNGVCSLNPNLLRFALTAKIEYDAKGNRKKFSIFQSEIESDHRLTYDFVNDFFHGKEDIKDKKLKTLLNNAKQLSGLIHKKRVDKGFIELISDEVEFIIDKKGEIENIQTKQQRESEKLIEAFMIEANEVVAEFLQANFKYGIYRVHAKPDYEKVQSFRQVCKTNGVNPPNVSADMEPKEVQQMIKNINQSKMGEVLGPMAVRIMQRAEYSMENRGHFGLASDAYTHFTSPIRRYPDLIAHRLLKYIIYGYSANHSKMYLAERAKHSSEMEQNSVSAEREIHLYKKLNYVQNHMDMSYLGTISIITKSCLLVRLNHLSMLVEIPYSSIKSDTFRANIDLGIAVGQKSNTTYKIGDNVHVSPVRLDFDNLEAEFKFS